MKIKEFLKKIGLSERDIKVYLAGLESGPALAIKLAKVTGVSRTNTYDILKSLEEKGLVSKGSKSYSKHYIMESPARLEEKLERRIEESKILKRELKQILPTFESLSPALEVAPKIKIFEGKEGIENLMEETLKTPTKETFAIVGGRDVEKIVDETFLEHYVQKRIQKGIKNKVIKKREVWKRPFESDKQELREVRYLPPAINFETTVIIYGDNVAIISSQKDDFGFTVKSREITHFFKTLFEILWGMSKKRGNK